MRANGADSPYFCIAPWTALYLLNDGHAYPCCHWTRFASLGSLHELTPEELWNSPALRQLRLEMLEGRTKNPRCEDCHRMEAAGERSLRQELLRLHQAHLGRVEATQRDGTHPDPSVVSLSLTVGDRCQLRCRMCGPWSSSSWQKALGEPARHLDILDPGSAGKLRSILERSDGLERLLFVGGEPLISDFHYEALDLLLAREREKKVDLYYHTNLFQLRWKSWDVTEYWRKFSRVTVFVSVDGARERFNAIRTGHDWGRLLRNLARLRERAPSVETRAYVTVSLFNLLDIPELLRTLLEERLFPIQGVFFNYARVPAYVNAQNAPRELKQEARKRYVLFMKELLAKNDARDAACLIAPLNYALRFLEEQEASAAHYADFLKFRDSPGIGVPLRASERR